MADWFELGYDRLIEDLVEKTDVSEEDVKTVYSWLVNIGLIDYDIEKEIIYEKYCSDDDLALYEDDEDE